MSETVGSITLNEQPKAATYGMSQRPEYRAVLERTFAHIRAAAPGLSVGERAPDFTLPDQLGRPVSLAERRAAGPVVIAFYRGDWCPHCNVMLRAMNAHLDRIQELGASLLAISPQAPDHALSLTEKHALGFEVLSDERQEVIAAYRLSRPTPRGSPDEPPRDVGSALGDPHAQLCGDRVRQGTIPRAPARQ